MRTLLSNFKKEILYFIKRNPNVKYRLKQLYFLFSYRLFRKTERMKTSNPIFPIFLTKKSETFFGYYDKSPVNLDNSYIIFHESKRATHKMPTSKEPVNIILKSLKEQNKFFRFTSSAYNWQQGSRIQWIDIERFIFNDYNKENDFYYSKIVNSNTGQIEKIIDFPIYDVYINMDPVKRFPVN